MGRYHSSLHCRYESLISVVFFDLSFEKKKKIISLSGHISDLNMFT